MNLTLQLLGFLMVAGAGSYTIFKKSPLRLAQRYPIVDKLFLYTLRALPLQILIIYSFVDPNFSFINIIDDFFVEWFSLTDFQRIKGLALSVGVGTLIYILNRKH